MLQKAVAIYDPALSGHVSLNALEHDVLPHGGLDANREGAVGPGGVRGLRRAFSQTSRSKPYTTTRETVLHKAVAQSVENMETQREILSRLT